MAQSVGSRAEAAAIPTDGPVDSAGVAPPAGADETNGVERGTVARHEVPGDAGLLSCGR